MNSLFGKISFSRNNHASMVLTDGEFRNTDLELYVERINNFLYDKQRMSYDDKNRILCTVLGYISNIEAVKEKYAVPHDADVEIVSELYARMNLRFVPELTGIFLLFIYDERTRKAYVLQGPYGYSLMLYYIRVRNTFAFATSLKQLLKRVQFPRALNSWAVADLFYYQFFVPNGSTLIQGVNKLLPSQYISVDCTSGRVKIKTLKRPSELPSVEAAKHTLLKSIQDEVGRIANQLERKDDIALPLSGGYDTNFLLYTLSNTTDASLTGFTIGGRTINEIPQAQAIVSRYDNAKHVPHVLNESMLDLLPEVVWRLEGTVVHTAVFLTYMLARLIAEAQYTTSFLAHCADQQLWGRTHFHPGSRVGHILKASFLRNGFRRFIGKRIPLQYYAERDWILKMSGIVLNSFGIQGLYPYLNAQTESMAISLGKLSDQKVFYKGEVKRLLGSEIARHIERQQGTTDADYIIDAGQDLVDKILGSESIRTILRDARSCRPEDNFDSPDPIRLIHVYLFKRLFIDGAYDEIFDHENVSLNLSEFI